MLRPDLIVKILFEQSSKAEFLQNLGSLKGLQGDIFYRDLTTGETSVTVVAMAFPVVEFSRQGYKIRKVFG